MSQLPYPKTHEEVLSLKEQYARESAKKKVEKMHKMYGKYPGMNICGECKHCVGMEHARVYWKCELYGITGGPGTDWRKSWQACGKFEAKA